MNRLGIMPGGFLGFGEEVKNSAQTVSEPRRIDIFLLFSGVFGTEKKSRKDSTISRLIYRVYTPTMNRDFCFLWAGRECCRS